MSNSRRVFFKGLAALVPTLVTIALIMWAYRVVNENFGAYITEGMAWLGAIVKPTPGGIDLEEDPLVYGTPIDEWDGSTGRRLTVEYKVTHNKRLERQDPKRFEWERSQALWHVAVRKYRLHLVGFAIAIVLVYSVGFFLASLIGRTTWRAAEGLLFRIPVIRAIYPNVKQVTDFLFSERKIDFSGVVAVQYPRMGIWSLALTTGAPMSMLQEAVPDELVTVFIPSSPTPFTGYVVQVQRKDVVLLNISIDEALRFVISAGVIKPGVPAAASGEEAPEA
ncbi:MAG TPA: DUF502 domain-containing protein [Phycisphaerae bacterium]|nr:DUF502 domain-containing protein [Phycisphaerae bacterium]HNU46212.1 DUF502 domain-containing protein [Phycisphaerae bacterium]